MTYERFEQLPVWQAAIKLGQQVYALTKAAPFRRQPSLRDQIERAAVSISNNIAEGFERGTTQELLTFLYIARGSAGEVRSMLCLMEGIPEFAAPQLPKSAALKSETSGSADLKSENFRFEIAMRRHLASTACLGRLAPELRDSRPALSHRESSQGIDRPARPGELPGGAGGDS